MTIILHPPGEVSFSGDSISAEERKRIGRALQAAVQRGLEKASRPGTVDIRQPPPRDRSRPETFNPARADLNQGIYKLPSYRNAGQPTGVKLLELIPKAAPGYTVGDGPSPLEGALVMILPANNYVHLASPRYVTAGTLTQAHMLGLAVFGSTSFAILQGPLNSRRLRYWAIGTDPAVSDADLGRQVTSKTEAGEETLPPELAGRASPTAGEELLLEVKGSDGDYLTRGLVTKDRVVHWRNVPQAAVWYAQLQAEQQKGVTAPPTAEFRRLVFADIDRLVTQIEEGDTTQLQTAAESLSQMDWVAFSLVGWETKARYLKVLLDAWTWQEEETAVVQIFRSLRSDSEVDAVIAMLKQAGRYDQLFDDLDSELYDLLTTVGERFPRDHGPLTLPGLIQLLQSMGLGPADIAAPRSMLDEANDAVMGFVRFGADLGESIAAVVTDPKKVAEGLAGLAQLFFTVALASSGYRPAEEKMARLLEGMGEKVLAGMRGADRLGCGAKVTRRIKWRFVWEIASLFVGAGEIRAVIEGAEVGEKLAGVLRVLTALGRLGEAADAEVEGARLARLATLIKTERAAFSSVEEVAELLSRLPDQDIAYLGQLISSTDIRAGETLAELAARNAELQAEVDNAITKIELLKSLADKAGGLTEEVAEAFHTLIGEDGLSLADAEKVVTTIPPGEGARFAATLRRIPLSQLGEGARASFLELLAASTGRMDAFAKLGADTFWSVYRRAGGQGEMLDRYLGVLDEIEDRLAGPDEAAGFRRLLDRLDRDDPEAWLEVEEILRQRDVAEEFAEAGRRGIPPQQPEGTQAIGQTPNPRTRAGVTDAEVLAANLERTLGPRPPGHHAHHIVPKGMAEAEEAWDILERAQIGINDAENGVWLPADYTVANPLTGEVHSTIHTPRYVRWVTTELRDALAEGGADAVAAKLQELRSIIMNGQAVR